MHQNYSCEHLVCFRAQLYARLLQSPILLDGTVAYFQKRGNKIAALKILSAPTFLDPAKDPSSDGCWLWPKFTAGMLTVSSPGQNLTLAMTSWVSNSNQLALLRFFSGSPVQALIGSFKWTSRWSCCQIRWMD